MRYYHALAGLFPAKDILVYTPAEVEEWADVPNAFITTALREGKVLYGDMILGFGQIRPRPNRRWMSSIALVRRCWPCCRPRRSRERPERYHQRELSCNQPKTESVGGFQ